MSMEDVCAMLNMCCGKRYSAKFDVNEWDELDHGGFGIVYTNRDDENVVAKTTLDESHSNKMNIANVEAHIANAKSSLEQERDILQHLKKMKVGLKQHIVELVHAFEEPDVVLVMSKGGTSVMDLLTKTPSAIEERRRQILYDTMMAVYHLHSCDVCHLDLKWDNVLYDESSRKTILIDFGFASRDIRAYREVYCGTQHWCCPEILQRTPYRGEDADNWSMGILIFCLFFRKFPFKRASLRDARFRRVKLIQTGNRVPEPWRERAEGESATLYVLRLSDEMPFELDNDIEHVLDSCLQIEPTQRLKWRERVYSVVRKHRAPEQ